jgi:glycosyltransferase involved in cell wall biosynthesis
MSAIVALHRVLRRERFDVISAHWILPNGFIARVVSALTSIPYTVSLPGSDVYIANKNFLFAWMARFAAEGTAVITADSPKYVDQLRSTGSQIKKFFIIPYPVDTNVLGVSTVGVDLLRKKYNIGKSTTVLLCVGRLIHKKGFQVLLSSLPQIIAGRSRVCLLIAGDGDMREQLVAKVKTLNVQKNVIFLGSVSRSRIKALYNLADIFVMPSIEDREGNTDDRPVALLEAMACGKAVVATDFPGNTLTIKHGTNGLLVPQQEPKVLAKTLLKLIASKQLRKRLGSNARRTIYKYFNNLSIGRQYDRLYREIIKSYG